MREAWKDARWITSADGKGATIWSYKPAEGEHIGTGTLYSGIAPGSVGYFADAMERHGHAITETWDRPWHHHVIGCGVGHDDARFAESGDSMAAYYDSGEAFGGPWWQDRDRYGSRRYYTEPLGRIPATRTRDGKPVRQAA